MGERQLQLRIVRLALLVTAVLNEPAKVLAVYSNLQWTSGCFAGIFPLVQRGTPPLQLALLTPAMVSYHQIWRAGWN
jgi:hypothetical protein